MPALTQFVQRAAALTADTRSIDSRQVREAVGGAAHSISHAAENLVKRLPTLSERQNSVVAIPTVYKGLNDGPSPGVVVGIVLGSLGGFLLILWLLWILSQGGGFIRANTYDEEEAVTVRRRSRSPRRHRRPEMVVQNGGRGERIIRQERIVRDVPAPRGPSRIRDFSERRVSGDDIVEVIEEHSSLGAPPPRRKSRRSSGYR